MESGSKISSKKVRGIWIMVCCAIVLVLGGGYWGLCHIWARGWSVETTDVKKYGEVLKEWADSGLGGHFPRDVPTQAVAVHFAAAPKVLQSCAYVQLRVRLPAEEIRQIEAQFKKEAIEAQFTDLELGTYVSPPMFCTADDPKARVEFPRHFTLYVLQATDLGGKWNHGKTRGVAVSTSTNEIVYWAEYW